MLHNKFFPIISSPTQGSRNARGHSSRFHKYITTLYTVLPSCRPSGCAAIPTSALILSAEFARWCACTALAGCHLNIPTSSFRQVWRHSSSALRDCDLPPGGGGGGGDEAHDAEGDVGIGDDCNPRRRSSSTWECGPEQLALERVDLKGDVGEIDDEGDCKVLGDSWTSGVAGEGADDVVSVGGLLLLILAVTALRSESRASALSERKESRIFSAALRKDRTHGHMRVHKGIRAIRM